MKMSAAAATRKALAHCFLFQVFSFSCILFLCGPEVVRTISVMLAIVQVVQARIPGLRKKYETSWKVICCVVQTMWMLTWAGRREGKRENPEEEKTKDSF